jgi:hypothetical protein
MVGPIGVWCKNMNVDVFGWAKLVENCEERMIENSIRGKYEKVPRLQLWAKSQSVQCTPHFYRAFRWFCGEHDRGAVIQAMLLVREHPIGGVPFIPLEYTRPVNETLRLRKIVAAIIQEDAATWLRVYNEKVTPRYAMEAAFWSLLFVLADTHPKVMLEQGFGWPEDNRMKEARVNYYRMHDRHLGIFIDAYTPVGGYNDAHIYLDKRGRRRARNDGLTVEAASHPKTEEELALDKQYEEAKQQYFMSLKALRAVERLQKQARRVAAVPIPRQNAKPGPAPAPAAVPATTEPAAQPTPALAALPTAAPAPPPVEQPEKKKLAQKPLF